MKEETNIFSLSKRKWIQNMNFNYGNREKALEDGPTSLQISLYVKARSIHSGYKGTEYQKKKKKKEGWSVTIDFISWSQIHSQ